MGLFDKLFQPKKNKEAIAGADGYFQLLSAYTPVFTTWRGELYESELIRAAIDARARHVSKLDARISGSAQPKLQTILRQAPNTFQTWSQFLYRTSTILDMQNTCFIIPILGEYLETEGFYAVLPSSCELVDVSGQPWLRYRFSNGQTAAMELERCAVLTKFQYRNDLFGETNGALDNTMQLISLENEGIEKAIKNSNAYLFWAQANNFSTTSDLSKERQRFSQDSFGEDAKASGMLLFPNTYKDIHQAQINPYTVDQAERDYIKTNVYNYFGVNEEILQNKTTGDQWNAFYEGAIEPFMVQLSQTMTKAIFSQREISQGSGFMLTANRLQYMSNNDKLNVSSQMADRGIMSRNEIREIWQLPPIPGGDTPTIRGEYYLLGGDGSVTKHADDVTGGKTNDGEGQD